MHAALEAEARLQGVARSGAALEVVEERAHGYADLPDGTPRRRLPHQAPGLTAIARAEARPYESAGWTVVGEIDDYPAADLPDGTSRTTPDDLAAGTRRLASTAPGLPSARWQ